MQNTTKLSLLVASMLGDDFTFERHEQLLYDVVTYAGLNDIHLSDIDFCKETISANMFLS